MPVRFSNSIFIFMRTELPLFKKKINRSIIIIRYRICGIQNINYNSNINNHAEVILNY
jgi:hypothetical protein